MIDIQKLVEKKNRIGVLEGLEALEYLRYVRMYGTDENKWTPEAQEYLTFYMLGLPSESYKFEIIAGKPVEPASPELIERLNVLRRRREFRERCKRSKTAKSVAVDITN